jgi:hypothetical protein
MRRPFFDRVSHPAVCPHGGGQGLGVVLGRCADEAAARTARDLAALAQPGVYVRETVDAPVGACPTVTLPKGRGQTLARRRLAAPGDGA